MKTVLKNSILVLIGLIIGVLITSACIFMHHIAANFMKPQILDISSEKIMGTILSCYIPIPEKAYNIDFYYQGSQNPACWLAFSESEKEITNMIDEMKKDALYRFTSRAEPRIPKDKKGKEIIDWWPKNYDNLEISSSDFFWIGYDKKNHRVFIYRFST
jgi:hypothetical protein